MQISLYLVLQKLDVIGLVSFLLPNKITKDFNWFFCYYFFIKIKVFAFHLEIKIKNLSIIR